MCLFIIYVVMYVRSSSLYVFLYFVRSLFLLSVLYLFLPFFHVFRYVFPSFFMSVFISLCI